MGLFRQWARNSACKGRRRGSNPESSWAQDAVRGDHGEVAQLLERMGGRIYKASEKRMVELSKSHVAGCAGPGRSP